MIARHALQRLIPCFEQSAAGEMMMAKFVCLILCIATVSACTNDKWYARDLKRGNDCVESHSNIGRSCDPVDFVQ